MATGKFQSDVGRLMTGALAEQFAWASDIAADEENRHETSGIFTSVTEVIEGGTEERNVAPTRSDFLRDGLFVLTQADIPAGSALWRGQEVYEVMSVHVDSTGVRRFALIPHGKSAVPEIAPGE